MNKKLLSLIIALILSLNVIVFAETVPTQAPQQEDAVLASVNGVEITKSQVEAYIPMFLEKQFIMDATDYQTVVTMLVRQEIMKKKIADLGFDKFSQEEEDSFASEADQQWEAAINSYAAYLQSADTEEAKLEAIKQAESIFEAEGIKKEDILADVRSNASFDRLNEYLLAGYAPGAEEIQTVFNEVGALYQKNYENDIPQYEYMTRFSGQTSWYTPAGYRGIVHILLHVDEALLKNYETLKAAFEEQSQTAEVPVEEDGTQDEAAETPATDAPDTAEQAAEASETKTPEVVTQEMVDQARQAIFDSKKEDIALIYDRLSRGESFLDLIKEYGTDPGMTVESNLEEGYPVHAQSIVYDPVFTQTAFSEKMKAVGDVSDPVVSSFGIHILYYLRDVPSGLILTDAVRQEIEDYLIIKKTNEVYEQSFEIWNTQETVVYNQEAIDAASKAAAELVQSPEETPLEAIPEDEDLPEDAGNGEQGTN
ncbi:MAG: peptidylprolyl isomerase [Bacillota bacterium]|nr:peptidylprolyl isomerase [Bacillota bacterium]